MNSRRPQYFKNVRATSVATLRSTHSNSHTPSLPPPFAPCIPRVFFAIPCFLHPHPPLPEFQYIRLFLPLFLLRSRTSSAHSIHTTRSVYSIYFTLSISFLTTSISCHPLAHCNLSARYTSAPAALPRSNPLQPLTTRKLTHSASTVWLKAAQPPCLSSLNCRRWQAEPSSSSCSQGILVRSTAQCHVSIRALVSASSRSRPPTHSRRTVQAVQSRCLGRAH